MTMTLYWAVQIGHVTMECKDLFLDALDQIESTARAASESMSDVLANVAVARQERIAGRPLIEIVDLLVDSGVIERRRRGTARLTEYERAVISCPAAIVTTATPA